MTDKMRFRKIPGGLHCSVHATVPSSFAKNSDEVGVTTSDSRLIEPMLRK